MKGQSHTTTDSDQSSKDQRQREDAKAVSEQDTQGDSSGSVRRLPTDIVRDRVRYRGEIRKVKNTHSAGLSSVTERKIKRSCRNKNGGRVSPPNLFFKEG